MLRLQIGSVCQATNRTKAAKLQFSTSQASQDEASTCRKYQRIPNATPSASWAGGILAAQAQSHCWRPYREHWREIFDKRAARKSSNELLLLVFMQVNAREHIVQHRLKSDGSHFDHCARLGDEVLEGGRDAEFDLTIVTGAFRNVRPPRSFVSTSGL